MKHLECGQRWVPKICHDIEYTPGAMAQSIACIDGNELLAGTVYDHYNGATVNAHILVKGLPTREWWVAIFDYPFNVLGVKKLIGQVPSTHSMARKLDEHFGFVEEARIRGYYGEGDDLIIYTMTREQCKFLNDPRWEEVRNRVRSA